MTVDATGKAQGRGAYLCPRADCARRALKAGILSRALRVKIDGASLTKLRALAEQLSKTGDASANSL